MARALAVAVSPKETVNGGIDLAAISENCHLNQYIFQTRMAFNKPHIIGQPSVNDFRSKAGSAILAQIVIIQTEIDIIPIPTEGISRHFQGIEELYAIGKEVPIFGGSDKPLRVVGRAVVKARIVGNNKVNVPFFDKVTHRLADVVVAFQHTLAAFDVVPVLGDFVGEVGGSHHFLVKKNVSVDEGGGFVDSAVLVNNGAPQVIEKGVINGVCGFSVKHKILFAHSLFSFPHSVIVLYHTLRHLSTPFSKIFFIFFAFIL